MCIPGSKKALPGLVWPKAYLAAIGKAIYERGVDVEMVLSNPNSIPGGLKGTEANYGNGWSCVDVAAEIIKSIQKQYSDVDDVKLRSMILDNLRICFIRHGKSPNYADGKTIGLHSKHFIVDDICCYIGSQNLYMCDLAEWGIVVDSEVEVKKIMNDYFAPMWENSYTGEDVDVEAVMDGLNVDRDGTQQMFTLQNADAAQQMMPHGAGAEYYDIEEEADITGQKDGEVKSPTEGKTPVAAAAKEGDVVPTEEVDKTQQADTTYEAAKSDANKRESPIARDDKDIDGDSASEQRETDSFGNAQAPASALKNDADKEQTAQDKSESPQKLATETKVEDDLDSLKKKRMQLDCCGIAESFTNITSE